MCASRSHREPAPGACSGQGRPPRRPLRRSRVRVRGAADARAGFGYNAAVPRAPSLDLAAWIPRLLAVWRAGAPAGPRGPAPAGRRGGHPGPARGVRMSGRGVRAPEDGLLPDELRSVAAAVQRLSRGLTRDRELAGARYMDEARLLGAYLLFYW